MLTGTLDDFSLPEIFRLISSATASGRIDVTRSAGTGTVFFKDGDVYFAESSLTHALAGGDEDRAEALRSQIEAAVFDLLRWDEGSFKWESGATVESETDVTLPIEDLVEEASRRLEELEVISAKIPSEAAIMAMAATPPEGASEINITPDEWRVLVLVNGAREVIEIVRLAGMDTFSVMRVLYGLCDHGLIVVADTGREPADAKDLAPEDSEAEPGEDSEELETAEEVPETSAKTTESEAEFAPVVDEPSAEISAEAIEATLPEPSVDRSAAVRELAGLFDHADG